MLGHYELELFASNAVRLYKNTMESTNNGALMDIYCMQGVICKNRNLFETFCLQK